MRICCHRQRAASGPALLNMLDSGLQAASCKLDPDSLAPVFQQARVSPCRDGGAHNRMHVSTSTVSRVRVCCTTDIHGDGHFGPRARFGFHLNTPGPTALLEAAAGALRPNGLDGESWSPECKPWPITITVPGIAQSIQSIKFIAFLFMHTVSKNN